jgi:hypothetical protein
VERLDLLDQERLLPLVIASLNSDIGLAGHDP